MNSSARFSFDDQGKRRFVGAPSGAISMSQFMPDLPMSSQRPVRTFAVGGSVSNEDINKYIQGVLSSGVSQQEAANQINAAAAQYGVSRDQIAGATGYGLDMVNQYLGAPAAAAPPPTSSAATPPSYFAAPAAATPPSTFATAPTAGSSTAQGALSTGNTYTEDRYNPNDPTSQGYIANPNAGQYVFDPSTGKHTLVSSTNAPTGALTSASTGAPTGAPTNAGTNTRQYNFEQGVRDWFAANPNATLDQVNAAIAKIDKGSYDPLTKTFTLDGMTYRYENAPGTRQSNFEQGVRDWFAANPNATLDQVNAAIAKINKGSYDPITRTFGLDGMTYKYADAPGYSQQQFQSIVDQYLANNPGLTYQQVQSQAQKLGLDYNPYTGKVTYGNLTYTSKGPRVSQQEFQAIVDAYFRNNPNATGEDAAKAAASFEGEYNPFTQTVTAGNLSYKTPLGAGATSKQFQSLVDKYLLGIKEKNLTGEDLVREAKAIGGDYNPFTKTVTYKDYTYNVPEAPGPTFNQFKGLVDRYLTDKPNATAADLYLTAKANNFDYDPFTKQASFGNLTYSPTGIKGYLNVPPDSVIVDQTVVNRYRLQLNELNALAENNNELQPLATRAKQIYDAVVARLVETKPPPETEIIDDSRPVVPLPGRTQPDANFRGGPPRVWNQLLGAFTYAPPAVVSSPNPRETAGAVGPGQGESWTPPVVTSRPRTLLNVRQNEIDPRTGLPAYKAGFDSETGVFTAPVARSSQAASDRSRAFAGLNAAMAGKKYTTPEYYSFLANVRGGAYGNPTDPDFASKVKTAVDAYYASKPAS